MTLVQFRKLTILALILMTSSCTSASIHSNDYAGFSMKLPRGWIARNDAFLTTASIDEDNLDPSITAPSKPMITAIIVPMNNVAEEDMSAKATELLEDGLASSSQEINPGITETLLIDDRPAATALFDFMDVDTRQTFKGRIVTIFGKDLGGSFIGIAPDADWGQFSSTFDSVIASIHFFTPSVDARQEIGIENLSATPITDSEGEYYSIGFAGEIAVGHSASGTLEKGISAHDWKFQGIAGQQITISVQAKTASLDTLLKVIDPGGTVIARNDDNDGANTTDPQLTITLPVTGEYIARIVNIPFGDGGTYTIYVTVN